MEKYIQPTTLPITYSQEVMTLGVSEGEGSDDEFGNYGSFDDDILMKAPKNHLWDDDDDKKSGL